MASEGKGLSFVASFISRCVTASGPQEGTVGISPGGDGDFAALCKHLVNAAGPTAASALYGEEIRSQVDEWLSFASATIVDRDPVSSSARLRTLDVFFTTRAVVGTGTKIGLADIALFVSVHDLVAALPTDELITYPNLLRWIDYVQNKDDTSRVYEWIPVVKAKFDPPVSSTEPDTKKVATSTPALAVKDKSVPATATPTPSQETPTKVVQDKALAATAQTATSPQTPSKTDTKVQQKEKKGKSEALPATKASTQDATKAQPKGKEEPVIQKDSFGIEILDIKVGIIKAVKKHPTAETLYVEDIDTGEGSLRQVVSGLAKYLTEDQMLNRRVLVLVNVKPSKLRDVMSSGLVLCTSNEDHSQCEPVIPPKESIIGERVTAAGYEGKPEAVLNPKKKQWEKIYPDLHTDDSGVACYKGIPLTTSAGPCTSSITKGTIK